MKEATGELSMTVITIVAVALIAGILALLKDPIKTYIEDTFKNTGNEAINTVKNPT